MRKTFISTIVLALLLSVLLPATAGALPREGADYQLAKVGSTYPEWSTAYPTWYTANRSAYVPVYFDQYCTTAYRSKSIEKIGIDKAKIKVVYTTVWSAYPKIRYFYDGTDWPQRAIIRARPGTKIFVSAPDQDDPWIP